MRFPVVDDLQWLAMTVWQEAAAEPFEGKLAVAYTVVTRSSLSQQSISDTVLKPLQYSAWNSDSPTKMRLDELDPSSAAWQDSYKATCAAVFRLLPDPTNGADHYLNEELTRKIRGGSLPGWFEEIRVTARIGRHTFLKLN